MTGPYSKLTPQQGYEFPSSVLVQIEVLTGLSLQTRIQHMHVDLYTDYEVSTRSNHIYHVTLNAISCLVV